jgi:hypothetical protein
VGERKLINPPTIQHPRPARRQPHLGATGPALPGRMIEIEVRARALTALIA